MKRATALLAVCIGIAPMALAQDHHDDNGPDRAAPPQSHRRAPPRAAAHHPAPPPQVAARGPDDGRDGAGPDHAFRRGGRLPPEYRSRQYVVDDWRAHHLSAPPRGYQWVQTGADYVLVAVATGLIANVLLNH